MAKKYLDYERLGPSYDFLIDDAVLFQALHKTTEYIRRHNWYADVLELDMASLDPRQVIRDCKAALSLKTFKAFAPKPMRIVPVPKREQWTLRGGTWEPEGDGRWRPLAHLAIRDQTLATAAMICLANLVETEQGDTRRSLPERLQEVYRKEVSNYGNRLYCRWEGNQAKFQWGNAHTYREYFQDYRAFIARPGKVAEAHSNKKLAVVSVDIERFYDCIDRKRVVKKLRTLAEARGTVGFDARFFTCLDRIFEWSWDRKDRATIKDFFGGGAGSGIPQGLVAGGFFANAYMLEFDRHLRRHIDDEPTTTGWKLLDYSRYVDDMRLVIWYDGTDHIKSLKADIVQFIAAGFAKYAPGLRLNEEKTDVQPLIAQPSVVQVGATMESLQSQVSGPLDPTAATQVLSTLNALFPLAEQAAKNARGHEETDTLLEELQSGELDVRPDTVERFAANRWKRVYRSLRAMTEKQVSLRALDEKAGLFIRTLIRRWIADPSNVRLLRVAFDVMPDVDQLNRYVLALILESCFSKDARGSVQLVGWYTLSELLKAGATETAFVRHPDELTDNVDVSKYRERLCEIAAQCQTNADVVPWYLLQQSALFLLIHGKHVTLGTECGAHYRVAMECLQKKWSPDATTIYRELPAALRTIDLGADAEYIHKKARKAVRALEPVKRRPVVKLLESYAPRNKVKLASSAPLPSGVPTQLVHVLDHPTAPFGQENAALRLAERLLELQVHKSTLTFGAVQVSCRDWTALADPSRSHDLAVSVGTGETNTLDAAPPAWCPPEKKWRLELAAILARGLREKRLVLPQITQTNIVRYWPSRMRRTGILGSLVTNRYQLGSPLVPVSPWMEEFLMHLGQWPGFVPYADLVTLPAGFGVADALTAVRARLRVQEEIFGKASSLPIYEVPIRFPKKKKADPFRVMLVQTAMPMMGDFEAHGTTLDGAAYRRGHRRHLSSVLKLITQTIETRATHIEPRGVDLIVFPELAIHSSDMDLMRLLISKTRAWVFCGLVFETLPHSGTVVNRGSWLIPTFRSNGVRLSRTLVRYDQGKHHLTPWETANGITPSRNCQWVIVGRGDDPNTTWRLSSSICFDATDLKLAADLRDVSDGYIVSALNRDVPTFDNMIAALHYHMFQHVALVNSGEFGGSSVQAPYVEHFVKNRVHAHGSHQVVISICEMKLLDFRVGRKGAGLEKIKSPPAGFSRGRP